MAWTRSQAQELPMDFVVILIFSTVMYYWATHSLYYSGYFDDAKEINSTVKLDND